MLKLPEFKSEADEADWWYDNRHLIEEDFLRSPMELVPGKAKQLLEQRRASAFSPDEQPVSGSAEPEALPKLPRSA